MSLGELATGIPGAGVGIFGLGALDPVSSKAFYNQAYGLIKNARAAMANGNKALAQSYLTQAQNVFMQAGDATGTSLGLSDNFNFAMQDIYGDASVKDAAFNSQSAQTGVTGAVAAKQADTMLAQGKNAPPLDPGFSLWGTVVGEIPNASIFNFGPSLFERVSKQIFGTKSASYDAMTSSVWGPTVETTLNTAAQTERAVLPKAVTDRILGPPLSGRELTTKPLVDPNWCGSLPGPFGWVCKNPGKSAAIALGIPTLLYLGPALIGRAKSWSRAVSS